MSGRRDVKEERCLNCMCAHTLLTDSATATRCGWFYRIIRKRKRKKNWKEINYCYFRRVTWRVQTENFSRCTSELIEKFWSNGVKPWEVAWGAKLAKKEGINQTNAFKWSACKNRIHRAHRHALIPHTAWHMLYMQPGKGTREHDVL